MIQDGVIGRNRLSLAAGRCDVYLGVGPAAEALARRTGAEGALYYLFVRPAEVATVGP